MQINFVEPGFNIGWSKVQGVWLERFGQPTDVNHSPNQLLIFDRIGNCSHPNFIWHNTVGPTAFKFLGF